MIAELASRATPPPRRRTLIQVGEFIGDTNPVATPRRNSLGKLGAFEPALAGTDDEDDQPEPALAGTDDEVDQPEPALAGTDAEGDRPEPALAGTDGEDDELSEEAGIDDQGAAVPMRRKSRLAQFVDAVPNSLNSPAGGGASGGGAHCEHTEEEENGACSEEASASGRGRRALIGA